MFLQGSPPQFRGAAQGLQRDPRAPLLRQSLENWETRMYSLKSIVLAMSVIGTVGLVAQTARAQNSAAPNAPAPGRGARPAPTPMPMDWVPKKTALTPYDAPNKPIWRLSD